jgi:hypothetical protein
VGTKSDKKSIKFGTAEYEAPTENERPSRERMRSYFLQNVSSTIPEVADELENELLPLYQQIPLFCFEADSSRRRRRRRNARWEWRDHNRPSWETIETLWVNRPTNTPFEVRFDDYYDEPDKSFAGGWISPFTRQPTHKDPNIGVFVEKLFVWSRRYYLDATWCRAHAYETLDLWCVNKNYRKARIWLPKPLMFFDDVPVPTSPISIIEHTSPKFIFEYVTHYPSLGFRKDIREEMIEAFTKKLDAFLDEREAEAKAFGLEPSPKKYAPHHFRWLAAYQVGGMSKKSLAKKYAVDRKTIIDGLNSAAASIELTLRK